MTSKIISQVNSIKQKIKSLQPVITKETTGENGYFGLNIEQSGRITKINLVDNVASYTSRGL